jgi:hypothetical protein
VKIKRFLLCISLAVLLLASCGKTCRCYRYDGDVVEFDMAELEANDETCEGKELVNHGLTYSLCERVLF